MSLEHQVGLLVSSTTSLQNTVAAELTKVRAENTAFKATVVEGVESSVDSKIVAFDGITGKKIKSVNASIDNNGNAFFNGVAIANKNNSNCFMLLSGGGAVGGSTTGVHNTIIGSGGDFSFNTTGGYNIGAGLALTRNTTGSQNAAVGVLCLNKNTTGGNNVGVGMYALNENTSGSSNVAVGTLALNPNTAGNNNTAVGFAALNQAGLVNCTGIGAGASVSASNQVQLGDSATTTFVFGTVQNRSDARDKADIRPTVLGLEFIKALRPVDYRWDMRDSYRTPMPPPLLPDVSDEEKSAYDAIMAEWQERSKLANIVHDGSQKKKRFHHGLIAQEVADLIKTTGLDFGGLQDHSRSGGDDVLSIGYDELIAPLIKAVQELAQANEELRGRITVLEARK
jgi:hypothetical protein